MSFCVLAKNKKQNLAKTSSENWLPTRDQNSANWHLAKSAEWAITWVFFWYFSFFHLHCVRPSLPSVRNQSHWFFLVSSSIDAHLSAVLAKLDAWKRDILWWLKDGLKCVMQLRVGYYVAKCVLAPFAGHYSPFNQSGFGHCLAVRKQFLQCWPYQ